MSGPSIPTTDAGRHRLEAVTRLGYRQIGVSVMDGTEVECRLWEIAENLHRADLTALERAEHIAEWVRLTEAEQAKEVSRQVVAKLPQKGVGQGVGGGRPESGTAAAAPELNISEREAQ